jgi:hypothetical protein
MSIPLLAAIAIAALFLIGTAMTFWRSPNANPLADLEKTGITTQAIIAELEPDGDEPNVLIHYTVESQSYKRSVPWKTNLALPEIGQMVKVRYLPNDPGLSRIVF